MLSFPMQYKSTDMVIKGPGTVELIFTPEDGSGSQPQKHLVYKFEGKSADGGVAMSMYNTDEVIGTSFKRGQEEEELNSSLHCRHFHSA